MIQARGAGRVATAPQAPHARGREKTFVDLRRLIAMARTWLPLMLVAAVAAGAAAFVVSGLQPKVYESRATLIVGQALSATNPDYTQILVARDLASTYVTIAKTHPILERVIEELDLDEAPDDLAARVQVEAPANSTTLFVTARDTDPARAAEIANTLSDQLIASTPTIQGREAEFQKSIDADLAATQALIDSTQARMDALIEVERRTIEQEAQLQALEGRLAGLRSTYATLLSLSSGAATNRLTSVEPARVSSTPVEPRTLFNTLLAVALGVLVVAGVAFVVEQLDDSVKDAEAARELTGFSALGTIPKMRAKRGRSDIYRLATLLYPRSGAAERFRTLRANIEFASLDAPMRTLLVTSSTPGEGKTVTAANLAVVFAQGGRRVLLVDADLRKPGAHLMFSLANERGLTTLLRSDEASLDATCQPTEEANLRVLTTGPLPPNPAELLGSQRMRTILDRLLAGGDLVIFDSPPLQAVTDAAILASFADGTLLVIDAGRSRGRAVRQAREALVRAGAHVLGIVLNRVDRKGLSELGDYYGHDLSASKGPDQQPPGPATSPTGSAPNM